MKYQDDGFVSLNCKFSMGQMLDSLIDDTIIVVCNIEAL